MLCLTACASTASAEPTANEQLANSDAGRKRPNIIMIMTDDQTSITVEKNKGASGGVYGFCGGQSYTPNLDKLASQGTVFTQANAVSPVSAPSRYTALTGRYATRSQGQQYNEQCPPGTLARVGLNIELDPSETNIARVLKQHGYTTGFVGKSHIVNHEPLEFPDRWESLGLKGYDIKADVKDSEITAKMKYNHEIWRGHTKDLGFDFADSIYAANLRELYLHSAYNHNLEWITESALRFIDQSQAEEKPFFLYYATTTPHSPYPWINRDGKYPFGLDYDPAVTGAGYQPNKDYSFMPTHDEMKEIVAKSGRPESDAYMTHIDAAIGAIIKKLEDEGILNDTIILFTADHGTWGMAKCTMYEGGLRVPMFITWPGKMPGNQKYNQLVGNVDFVPTLLDLAGIEVPEEYTVDGKSLKQAVAGEAIDEPVRDELYAEIGYARSIKTDRYKYISVRYPDDLNKQIEDGVLFVGWNNKKLKFPYYTLNPHLGFKASRRYKNYWIQDQLYDLKKDPFEKNNIAEKHPKIVERMQEKLRKYVNSFEDRPYGEFTK